MKTLYVISTDSFSGKSGIILSLGLRFEEQQLKVGYMKPLSTLPVKIEGVLVDEDAHSTWKSLNCDYSLKYVSPIVLSSQFVKDSAQMSKAKRVDLINEAFREVSKQKDIVLLEGAADLKQGRFLEMSVSQVTKLLGAKTLLVVKAQSDFVIDEIMAAKDSLGQSLIGVIFNVAPPNFIRSLEELIQPIIEKEGIKVFGIIPEDKVLQAVTISEIAEHLGGEVLCAQEKTGELVEEFMVGAMSQEHALRYFRRKQNKAVITGGDRPDIQLAALETATKCIILTGNFRPSPIVLARAEELEVPMILADVDTYGAVDRMEELIGRVDLHEKRKINRMQKLLDTHIDIKELYKEIGLKYK